MLLFYIVISSLEVLMKRLSGSDLGVCALTLSQPSGFSFGLQERQHISLSDWALHISDDGAAAVVHEVHTDLKADQGSAQQTPPLSILKVL